MPFFGGSGGGGAAGIGGSTGATDNAVLRADGTGAATLQNSALVIDDPQLIYSITGVASTDVITAVGHNFTTNQAVKFISLTGGAGLSTAVDAFYYARDISGDTFKVSSTSGGSAFNFTTDISAGTIVGTVANVRILNNDSQTNSSVVITPKGQGSFILGPKPDGSLAGGVNRGINAVDLSMSRDGIAKVARGDYSICAGQNVTASGNNTVVLGWDSQASVGGAVAIGRGATAGASQAVAIGGLNATASAQYATNVGGHFAEVSGQHGFMGAGDSNTVNATAAATLGGSRAVADRYCLIAQAAGRFSTNGDAQRIFAVLRNKISAASATELFLDGSSVRLTVPSGKTMACIVNIAASTSGGEFANMYVRQFIIANRGGTTALRGSVQTIGVDIEGIAGADVSITADDTNDSAKIEFTGVAPVTGCTADAGTDVISKVAHGYADNDDIIFTLLTGGVGLTANTVTYFVRDATADTFKVSATRGGTAVNITTNYTDMTAARLFRVVASVDAVEIGHGT